MKRLILFSIIAALFAATATAAEWDGKRGGVTLFTMFSDPSVVGLGLGSNPLTWFSVLADDPSVNEVQVSIQFRDEYGNWKIDSRTGSMVNSPWITVVFPIRPSQVIGGPKITTRVVKTIGIADFAQR